MHAHPDLAVSEIAAAIGEPARARILYSLLDGHARTSTELAAIAEVSPSTASVHLSRLQSARLIRVASEGRHRFYSLAGAKVANALEGLSVIAGFSAGKFVPTTPQGLRSARTCYDHIAGRLGVLLHDRLLALGWIAIEAGSSGKRYEVTSAGARALESLGVRVAELRPLRRKFAYACLDWSERRPHIAGALGAALLECAVKCRWVVQDLDSRALQITSSGRRQLLARFGLRLDAA
ncbi:MAG TPA: helix-turn-helix transcriptional regulator [Terriglobales bacterium]|nr:helix-turn-helix transcriptional regulator [Terriglobales bacterium]